MRLFGWFRKKPAVDDYVGRHRPGSWGEIALPPMESPPGHEQPATVTAAPTPAVVPAPVVVEPVSPVADPSVPDGPPVEAVEAVEVVRQRVRLGFADGTSVDLDDDSGASEALFAAARRIIVE